MTEELKDCPFCRSAAEMDMMPGRRYRIVCSVVDCATGPICTSERRAVRSWNRRATPAPAQPEGAQEDERSIIDTYERLHAGKIGAHWLWCVIEQIAAGVPEDDAMRDFGYYERVAGATAPSRNAATREALEKAPRSEYIAFSKYLETFSMSLAIGRGAHDDLFTQVERYMFQAWKARAALSNASALDLEPQPVVRSSVLREGEWREGESTIQYWIRRPGKEREKP